MRAKEPLLGANVISLSICYQHLSARINRLLEPKNLNMTQMSILTYFSRMPMGRKVTITGLSEAMQMNQPMVTKSVKSMQAHGLIERTSGKEDARMSFINLSNRGREVLSEAQALSMPAIEEAFSGLSIIELQQLYTLLAKIKV